MRFDEKGFTILGIIKWHVIKRKKVLRKKIIGFRAITNYVFWPLNVSYCSKNV